MRTVKRPSQTSLLLNGAAILVVVASIGVVLHSAFVGDQVAPCKERFVNGTRFSLESNGEPISMEQLQGELSNTDWGLTSGARVISVKSSPSKHVLEFDLASAPAVSGEKSSERAGIGFEWAPYSFGRRQAACLSYSVYVPAGFTFGQGGRLPGLRGEAADKEADDTRKGFSIPFVWGANGELSVHTRLSGQSDGHSIGGKTETFALTPGKWTELEQEVVLNAPGANDGMLRVWQDGNLVLAKKDLSFGVKPGIAISGVLAEAAAGASPASQKRGSQKIELSPFELRWN
jgi:hypothetical protein